MDDTWSIDVISRQLERPDPIGGYARSPTEYEVLDPFLGRAADPAAVAVAWAPGVVAQAAENPGAAPAMGNLGDALVAGQDIAWPIPEARAGVRAEGVGGDAPPGVRNLVGGAAAAGPVIEDNADTDSGGSDGGRYLDMNDKDIARVVDSLFH